MPESLPPSVREFAWVDDAIPRYGSFYTVDEHRERDRALADAHDHVGYEAIGESADGEELWAVTVGEGARSALLFGAPHPNEPIGSMTVDFLVHALATDDELRSSLDYEFVCVPVADPDGVRRNEGWFDGPFTLSNYALNFYRPPPDEQVEATFPIDREGYAYDDPTPATRALADLIETHRPEFVCSLHNEAFGGCYYYLTEPLDALYGALQSLPEAYDVPLRRGEPEWFGAEAFDDAVYSLRTFDDQYESVRGDAAAPEDELLGGTAYDYARRFDDDVVEFVVELPYFADPRIGDRTELDRTREDVIREGVRRRQALVEAILAELDPVAEHLPDTSMAREATGVFSYWADEYDAKREWAASADETDEPATVASHLDERYLEGYHLLTYLGMLLRSIDHAAMRADGEARESLVAAKTTLEGLFHEHVAELRTSLDYETIPIRDLVAIQARACLLCLDYRQSSTGGS